MEIGTLDRLVYPEICLLEAKGYLSPKLNCYNNYGSLESQLRESIANISVVESKERFMDFIEGLEQYSPAKFHIHSSGQIGSDVVSFSFNYEYGGGPLSGPFLKSLDIGIPEKENVHIDLKFPSDLPMPDEAMDYVKGVHKLMERKHSRDILPGTDRNFGIGR